MKQCMSDQHQSHDHQSHDHQSHDHQSHDHQSHDGHHHHHGAGLHTHPVVKNLTLALILNLSFTIIEFVGGAFTNSMAILSDAIHDLGDSIAIAASIWLERYSMKGRTAHFTYGNRRFSPLAATITSCILITGSILICIEAIPRLMHPQPVKTGGMLWLSILGLVFNGLAAWRLSRGERSLNQRAVMLHMIEDVLGWVAVLVGSIIMHFTAWYWIDPLLSLMVAAFVLYNAVRNVRNAFFIFLQGTPEDVHEEEIEQALLKIPMVRSIHDMHVWTMDGSFKVLSAHVVIDPSADAVQIYKVQTTALSTLLELDIQHPTVQVEPENGDADCILKDC